MCHASVPPQKTPCWHPLTCRGQHKGQRSAQRSIQSPEDSTNVSISTLIYKDSLAWISPVTAQTDAETNKDSLAWISPVTAQTDAETNKDSLAWISPVTDQTDAETNKDGLACSRRCDAHHIYPEDLPANLGEEVSFQGVELCGHLLGEVFEVGGLNDLQALHDKHTKHACSLLL